MKYGVYCIRDHKTGFLTPTIDINDASASRNFAHAAMQTNSLFFTHPADYTLFKLGEFDSDDGMIVPYPTPIHIVDASSFKEV